ncbi:hypothetical protein ACIBCM_24285 [Streptomyces sp. NPDC051018]|uniref:hypothetical protein n=1 Tax=Streptomyces sp. NPDC051018 TaxID=3365639 RepID=UPI00379A84D6
MAPAAPADPREAVTVLEVPHQGSLLEFPSCPSCHSELGRPLIAGLPDDFAGAVLTGLADESAGALSAGTLRIDRAGFDPAGSSGNVFSALGRLLRGAISASQNGREPEEAVQGAMRRW